MSWARALAQYVMHQNPGLCADDREAATPVPLTALRLDPVRRTYVKIRGRRAPACALTGFGMEQDGSA